ncbi:MAG: hypothetical protein WAN74_05975 [Thermoplasmata archaeon]
MAFVPPGAGPYNLSLATPAFYLLAAILGIFVGMLFVLRHFYPNRRTGLEGYLDAAGVSLAFLVLGVILVVVLAMRYPQGNRDRLRPLRNDPDGLLAGVRDPGRDRRELGTSALARGDPLVGAFDSDRTHDVLRDLRLLLSDDLNGSVLRPVREEEKVRTGPSRI